ncbi:MAG: response regulator [Polyangiales bacterium]
MASCVGRRRARGRVDGLVGVDTVILRTLPAMTPAHPAVFGVWLDAEGAVRLALDPAGLSSARGAALEATTPPGRPPVLVIDDSLTTRMLEQSILESAGYEVDVAVSGEEGMAKARERRYGLFLVDVEMPGMDGFTFVERTRADPDLRAVPAILVTSRASPEDRARGAAAGAVGHIEKSAFNQAELIARIRGLIG